MADIDIITNTFVAGTDALAAEVNANFTDVNQLLNGDLDSYLPAPVLVPIGSIVAWHKTFNAVDSGTADTNTADALEDSGADFVNDGVLSGMVVYNSDDNTFAVANAVTATKVTLTADVQAGSATTDIFPLGSEGYSIYATPKLPDGWVECNGQAISDADSPYNGQNAPSLNGTTDATKGFIRGAKAITTDDAVTDVTHIHSSNNTIPASGVGGSSAWDGSQPTTTATRAITPYAEMVWIIRIK
jgi:hypothetical protein